jgi:SAM-dependent methyltransferase
MADHASPWEERATDWADVMEGEAGWGLPVYEHILDSVRIGSGDRVLDVGCGAGRFCRLAADRGAAVAGLDATAAFIAIAGERVPEGEFQVGDMEHLPFRDDEFDLVTGFNSFFIASDMADPLREAGRVARNGAVVATTVFGRPDRCDSTTLFGAVRALFPPPEGSGSGPGEPGLHEEGVLEDITGRAGLTVREAGYFAFTEQYPDSETLARGMMAAPPMVRAGRAAGDDAVREALLEAAKPFTDQGGAVRLSEEVRYLIAGT